MISNPNTTRRMQFAMAQAKAAERENRAALSMFVRRPGPGTLVEVNTAAVAAKLAKAGL